MSVMLAKYLLSPVSLRARNSRNPHCGNTCDNNEKPFYDLNEYHHSKTNKMLSRWLQASKAYNTICKHMPKPRNRWRPGRHSRFFLVILCCQRAFAARYSGHQTLEQPSMAVYAFHGAFCRVTFYETISFIYILYIHCQSRIKRLYSR
jgi:hypothetical protein